MRDATVERGNVERALAAAGCVDPVGEAEELLRAAADRDRPVRELVGRRVAGEPLAWIVGTVPFLDRRVGVAPGVFVPRPQTELVARRAIELLPPDGTAVDLCTGCGAIAVALAAARPGATVVATDLDPAAVACARGNGVDALLGDLDAPLPSDVFGAVDVVTAVVPYVPDEELRLLPRDVLAHEPRLALDGGPDGTAVLRRTVGAAARLLRRGGSLVFELGGDQADQLTPTLTYHAFTAVRVLHDEDRRVRAIEASRPPRSRRARGRLRPMR
jgi:release factor glutamine methyltransferase